LRKIRSELKASVEKLGAKGCAGLAVVLVGEDPASKVYVSMKEKACSDVVFFQMSTNFRRDFRNELLELIAS